MNKKEKPHLIVDCDGVLFDPILSFVKWALFNFPKLDIIKILKNNFDFLNHCMISFLDSRDFEKMLVIKNSNKAIEFLKNYYKIDVITSCGDDKKIRDARILNLENTYGKNTFNEIYTMPLRGSKESIYSNYKSGTIVIDDELPNLLSAKSLNLNIYWLKYHNFLTRTFITKHSKEDEKNLKQLTWNNIIKEIKTSHISK